MGRTVSELESTLSVSEFKEWTVFYGLEPFGAWRDNWHAAMVAHILANVNRGKSAAPIPLSDFMYSSAEERSKQTTKAFTTFLDSNTED